MRNEGGTGHVYRARLDQGALAGLLRDRFEGAHSITRRIDWCDTCEIDLDNVDSLLTQWDEAQVFNDGAEIRWRRSVDGYAVLLLMENDLPPGGFVKMEDSPFAVIRPSSDETQGFLMWGTRADDNSQWWEARIPRSLSYPIITKARPPRLIYRLYKTEGYVRWVRLVRFVEE